MARVRVRVIFQNRNPFKRVDLFAIVSAVRTLPEARPTFLDPPTSGEQRVRVIFQNPNPKMLRPFRFRLSRSDPPGGPTSVSRAPIDPKTKPSRESFSKVQYFGQKSQFSCFIWHQNRPFFTFSFPSQLFGPSRRLQQRF